MSVHVPDVRDSDDLKTLKCACGTYETQQPSIELLMTAWIQHVDTYYRLQAFWRAVGLFSLGLGLSSFVVLVVVVIASPQEVHPLYFLSPVLGIVGMLAFLQWGGKYT